MTGIWNAAEVEICATSLDYKHMNEMIRNADSDVLIKGCFGQRYIGCGAERHTITVEGTPGNALGAYLEGSHIIVRGNAQDAVGDTMNMGRITIHGHAGDALGYAMRGGEILIRGNSGYRTGIHMKEYQAKSPLIIVGGTAGSFLGEYMAGGCIVVLGMNTDDVPVGNFTGAGFHGGQIWIRSERPPKNLPAQVCLQKADDRELAKIRSMLEMYADTFQITMEQILAKPFYLLTPNAKNPYKQLYTIN